MENNKKERRRGIVRVRGGFSDITGISPRNNTIQLEEFDDDTRTKISNKLYEIFEITFDYQDKFSYAANQDYSNAFCKALYNDVFCQRNNLNGAYGYDWRRVFEEIHKVVEEAPYNEVLDIVEYICRWVASLNYGRDDTVFSIFNQLFEKEYVGYRFINGRIVAISDKIEIDAIEESCQNCIEGCRIQIQKALAFLADRNNKDYKNSIKESISAVESICQVITNDESLSVFFIGTAI